VKVAAKIISIIFHPLMLTTYLAVLLTTFFPSMLQIYATNRWVIIAGIFFLTFGVPSLYILVLRTFGNLSSLTMENREQRLQPFFFIAIIYIVVTFFLYYKLPFSINFNKLMLIVTALVVVSWLITLFFKISIHSLAMGGAIGILLPLNKVNEEATLLWPTAFVILIAGLVMSSRLHLGAHTSREVMYGGAVGVLVGMIGMTILF
jgi:membrane-associated phospholipid phosphatase